MENDKLIVKKSGISGKGVFAKSEIKKGGTILFLEGEEMDLNEVFRRIDSNEEVSGDPLQIGEDKYLDLNEFSRQINHSCDPNSFVREKNELVAMRDIEKGEEITFDYSTTMSDDEERVHADDRELWDCKCSCGAKNCRKIIDQFKTLPKKRREFYLKNKYVPNFILKKFG
ncbi:hypothetical protein CMI45_02830 [Candidatus Pacearchaeota archaeon]|jgi:SET domain-containing protein|nr:hypothetical protein [Candidatus Pacearchaeota archaeon]|tara:strand:- start:160 stop:672 length:513 start_codon:yes stop_codon:yes gene_type:complete